MAVVTTVLFIFTLPRGVQDMYGLGLDWNVKLCEVEYWDLWPGLLIRDILARGDLSDASREEKGSTSVGIVTLIYLGSLLLGLI